MKGQSRPFFGLRTKKGLETMIQKKFALRTRKTFFKYALAYLTVLLAALSVTASLAVPSEKTYMDGKEVSSVFNIPDTSSGGTYTVTMGGESTDVTLDSLIYGSGGMGGRPGGDMGTPPGGNGGGSMGTPHGGNNGKGGRPGQ